MRMKEKSPLSTCKYNIPLQLLFATANYMAKYSKFFVHHTMGFFGRKKSILWGSFSEFI
jgi:hypothetical protein